jgi:hypothetical protein
MIWLMDCSKAWMAGTSPAMTELMLHCAKMRETAPGGNFLLQRGLTTKLTPDP